MVCRRRLTTHRPQTDLRVRDYFIATGVLFSLSWLHRQIRIYFEHGINHRANISLAANGFICVRIPTAAIWDVGQHFFVRFLSLGVHAISIHPFTACSLPGTSSHIDGSTSELVLYIRPQAGFTARLAHYAETHPNGSMRVLLDGPYGGVRMQKISNSQRQLVIAGGSGAGWLLPMITTFLRQTQTGSNKDEAKSPRSAKVVLVTRDVATHQWFEETLRGLLATFGLEKVPTSLEIELYYTGSHDGTATAAESDQFLQKLDEPEKTAGARQLPVPSGSDTDSSSESGRSTVVKHHNGRPDLQSIIRGEAISPKLAGQLGVFVCGPASMQVDVSNAVAEQQIAVLRNGTAKDVYLHMEHFSWA
jgi:NAD(P)H-flavin reductase